MLKNFWIGSTKKPAAFSGGASQPTFMGQCSHLTHNGALKFSESTTTAALETLRNALQAAYATSTRANDALCTYEMSSTGPLLEDADALFTRLSRRRRATYVVARRDGLAEAWITKAADALARTSDAGARRPEAKVAVPLVVAVAPLPAPTDPGTEADALADAARKRWKGRFRARVRAMEGLLAQSTPSDTATPRTEEDE